MKLGRPTLEMVKSPEQLLGFLADLFAQFKSLLPPNAPSTVPALQCVTLPTHQALRTQTGDLNGQLGPRAIIVTGKLTPLDGGQGIFAWDPTSTAADDDATVIQANALPAGRWRKGSF